MGKSVSESQRAQKWSKKPFLTPNVETSKDIATKRGEGTSGTQLYSLPSCKILNFSRSASPPPRYAYLSLNKPNTINLPIEKGPITLSSFGDLLFSIIIFFVLKMVSVIFAVLQVSF